ncbi:MAG: branched-chain amino acid ABC transporter permease [Burkholderiales bacterium]|nr:branched-chain amino acid ABC transporter permease [Burkholderiales bacterium]
MMRTLLSRSRGVPLMVLALLVALPFVSGPYLVYLVTLALTFSIFALGYDLLFGHTGIVSFGHSVLYGLPAYAIGILSQTVFDVKNPVALIGVALLAGVLLGAAMGWLCSYTRGIYLAIVTFALAHVSELFIFSDPRGITQGENSITRIRPSAIVVGDFTVDLFSGVGLYYLTLAFLVLVLVGLTLLMRSQWGRVFRAIHQNEERLSSLGYNTRPYKILAFAFSGGICAIAGSMVAFLNNVVSPAMVDWQVGAEILLITVLGGAGTMTGPILGSFVVVFTQTYATSLVGQGNWVYVLGALYILVALFLPGGIVNALSRLPPLYGRFAGLGHRGKGLVGAPPSSRVADPPR